MANDPNDIALGSFVDTGHWKLLLTITADGMVGLIKNIQQTNKNPLLLFRNNWNADEGESLKNVENTVYENPRMLDDFATQIIIEAPKSLWIPSKFAEEDEYDDKYFTKVYKALPEDIFADFYDEEICLFTLMPGLKSFLSRTLPGCRISSHIAILKEYYQAKIKGGNYIFLDIRDKAIDILAFSNKKFLSAATHPCEDFEELRYRILLLADAYNLELKSLNLSVFATNDKCKEIAEEFEMFIPNIEYTRWPEAWQNAGLSHATGIVLDKK